MGVLDTAVSQSSGHWHSSCAISSWIISSLCLGRDLLPCKFHVNLPIIAALPAHKLGKQGSILYIIQRCDSLRPQQKYEENCTKTHLANNWKFLLPFPTWSYSTKLVTKSSWNNSPNSTHSPGAVQKQRNCFNQIWFTGHNSSPVIPYSFFQFKGKGGHGVILFLYSLLFSRTLERYISLFNHFPVVWLHFLRSLFLSPHPCWVGRGLRAAPGPAPGLPCWAVLATGSRRIWVTQLLCWTPAPETSPVQR